MTRAFPEPGCSYESLPKEMRLRILSFTHLSSQAGSYHDPDKIISIQGNKLMKNHWLRCCNRCTETYGDGCCPTNYAAYSASCVCRQIPTQLFLVSKTMYSDAFTTLYSENCFEFHQDPEMTISFLCRLPAEASTLIRRIQFRFSVSQVLNWQPRGLEQQ